MKWIEFYYWCVDVVWMIRCLLNKLSFYYIYVVLSILCLCDYIFKRIIFLLGVIEENECVYVLVLEG